MQYLIQVLKNFWAWILRRQTTVLPPKLPRPDVIPVAQVVTPTIVVVVASTASEPTAATASTVGGMPNTPGVGTTLHSAEELKAYLGVNSHNWLSWKYVAVHHSETDDDGKDNEFDAIRRYHIQHNGWKEIGYHFLIEEAAGGKGFVLRVGRPLNMAGSHVAGMNHEAIGICHVGDYDHYKPSPELWQFSVPIVKVLMEMAHISADKVLGHREFYPLLKQPVLKTCPGTRWDLGTYRLLLTHP